MVRFKLLGGDVNWKDYGAKWYARASKRRYYVIEFTNMDEACGRDNEGHDPYVVELSEIDLDNVAASTMDGAWKSCGDTESAGVVSDLEAVEALHSYGSRAPMGSWSGSNAHALLKSARREANDLEGSPATYHTKKYETPVNALGSTAAEYASGDFDSATMRGVAKGDTRARIMAKIQYGYDDALLDAMKEET